MRDTTVALEGHPLRTSTDATSEKNDYRGHVDGMLPLITAVSVREKD